jgi:uncharacterized protein
MKNKGEDLFFQLLKSFNNGVDEVVKLFNENAIIEYPYAESIQLPSKLSMDEYRKYLNNILPSMPHITFSNSKVYEVENSNKYWAESDGEVAVPDSSKIYKQHYVMYFEITDGLFSFYKEFWNPVAFTDAYIKK